MKGEPLPQADSRPPGLSAVRNPDPESTGEGGASVGWPLAAAIEVRRVHRVKHHSFAELTPPRTNRRPRARRSWWRRAGPRAAGSRRRCARSPRGLSAARRREHDRYGGRRGGARLGIERDSPPPPGDPPGDLGMTRDRGRDPLRAWLRAQRLRQQETLDIDFDIAMALRGGGDQRAQPGGWLETLHRSSPRKRGSRATAHGPRFPLTRE